MTPVNFAPDDSVRCTNYITGTRADSHRCFRTKKEGSDLCGICLGAKTRSENKKAEQKSQAAQRKSADTSLKKQSQAVIDVLDSFDIEATASYRISARHFSTIYDGGITLSAEEAQKLRYLLRPLDKPIDSSVEWMA